MVPDWFQHEQSNAVVFGSELWKKSEPHCRGLFTLSEYLRRYLASRVDVPVSALCFPTEIPTKAWSPERYRRNPDKKIIQIGWWLRKLHAIFQLEPCGHHKVFLRARNEQFFDELMAEERARLERRGEFSSEMYDSAEVWNFVPNRMYDQLLSENIVFLELYDTSANNVVVECLARSTPLLVNPLPAVVEYLGEDYPLYFSSLEEAAAKARNDDLIHQAHEYLAHAEGRERLTGEHFRRAFEESAIYRGL
jgi:hypothetical protein